MKLTVSNWLVDFLKVALGRSIEILFRVVLCLLPLGVYMLLVQNRSKVSSISSLYAFTGDSSVWQHVFPGFMLVAVDKNMLRASCHKANNQFQEWVKANKYSLAMAFMVIVVGLMVYSYIFK